MVQFYRTLAINLVSIVVTNPMYRCLTFAPLLLIFIVHDHHRQPYKNTLLNRLQSLSSKCWLLVLVCNVVASVSYMVDVTSIPGVMLVVGVLSVVEVVLYVVVPLYLPLSFMLRYLLQLRAARKKGRRYGVVHRPNVSVFGR